jgi:hypothetical protein
MYRKKSDEKITNQDEAREEKMWTFARENMLRHTLRAG